MERTLDNIKIDYVWSFNKRIYDRFAYGPLEHMLFIATTKRDNAEEIAMLINHEYLHVILLLLEDRKTCHELDKISTWYTVIHGDGGI